MSTLLPEFFRICHWKISKDDASLHIPDIDDPIKKTANHFHLAKVVYLAYSYAVFHFAASFWHKEKENVTSIDYFSRRTLKHFHTTFNLEKLNDVVSLFFFLLLSAVSFVCHPSFNSTPDAFVFVILEWITMKYLSINQLKLVVCVVLLMSFYSIECHVFSSLYHLTVELSLLCAHVNSGSFYVKVFVSNENVCIFKWQRALSHSYCHFIQFSTLKIVKWAKIPIFFCWIDDFRKKRD